MVPGKSICFVIMPYEKKENFDGEIIDFDRLYDSAIQPAVNEVGLECIRSDRVGKAGRIHNEMFRNIIEADVVIVDITTLNPNVFYELGVRHTARQSVTILIGSKGTHIPFNINDRRVIEYKIESESDYGKLKETIKKFIISGLENYGENDSPIYEDLEELKVQIGTSPPIQEGKIYQFVLKDKPSRKIGIITGNLKNIKVVDIWVNSENLRMEMARHYDRAISAVIRYYGAKKNKQTMEVEEDTIQEELSSKVPSTKIVPDATVIPTGPGELWSTHNVKKIFHVAAVQGNDPGSGFRPIEKIADCVKNCLEKADSEEFSSEDFKSILFPLIGTGTSRGDLKKNVPLLINAALQYFKTTDSRLEYTYFLAWNEAELDICRRIITNSGRVELDSMTVQNVT